MEQDTFDLILPFMTICDLLTHFRSDQTGLSLCTRMAYVTFTRHFTWPDLTSDDLWHQWHSLVSLKSKQCLIWQFSAQSTPPKPHKVHKPTIFSPKWPFDPSWPDMTWPRKFITWSKRGLHGVINPPKFHLRHYHSSGDLRGGGAQCAPPPTPRWSEIKGPPRRVLSPDKALFGTVKPC